MNLSDSDQIILNNYQKIKYSIGFLDIIDTPRTHLIFSSI